MTDNPAAQARTVPRSRARHVPAQDPHARILRPRPPRRVSPGKTKKAGDFPARKPGEPSVTNVVRRIEFHLFYPWQII